MVAKNKMVLVIVVSEPDSFQTHEMMCIVHRLPACTCFPLLADNGQNQQWLNRHVECVSTRPSPVSGTTFAIVSDGEKCSESITTCAAVKDVLVNGLQ